MKAINRANNKLVRHRERLRAAGLRPVHFWVPDTCTPEFAALLRMQCLQLAKDLAETEALGFTEQVATHIDSWHWIGNGYECAKTKRLPGLAVNNLYQSQSEDSLSTTRMPRSANCSRTVDWYFKTEERSHCSKRFAAVDLTTLLDENKE